MSFDDTFYNSEGIFIHFPPTAVGKTSKVLVEIPQFHEEREFFQVVCDKNIDILDQVCSVEYKRNVSKNTRETFIAKFTPKVPFCQMYNYFRILEINGHHINLFVYTESIGPVMEVSTEEIQFLCNDRIQERKKVFEIRNISKIDSIFQFDIDPKSGFFSVDKLNGTIRANTYIYINVYYRGNVPGIHATKLSCLFEDCAPILINVSAINTKNTDGNYQYFCATISNCIYYPFPRNESFGYKGYLQDITPITHFDRPFSITKTFINFNYVKSGSTSKKCGFSVINHMKYDNYIVWEVDSCEIFGIEPVHCTIKSNDSGYFDCHFRPQEADKLYGTIISGSIYWISPIEDAFTIPIPLSIRFIGHSFPPDHGIWIPEVSLKSEYVIMPPCLPNFCCYKTITLLKTGILPVLFEFVPPENTKYILKPMTGLIIDGFQIVVVSLCSNIEEEEISYENWKVILNNNCDYEIKFQLRGKTEYPMIEIGDNNSVEFNTCRTKCQQGALVKIHNKTRHSVKCETIIPPKLKHYLQVYEDTNIILAHECIFIFWLWTGVCNAYQSIDVNIKTTAIRYKEIEYGVPKTTKITAYGIVTPTELCSIPSSYYHNECEMNIPFKAYFHLFNFGESEVHYQLDCLYETDFYEQEVHIHPYFETIQPKNNQKITVTVIPKQTGLQQFHVVYNIRKHMYSSEIIHESSKLIFKLHYFCVLPTLQVVDLLHDNFTPILSKMSLWNLLGIERLNKALKDVFPNERKEVLVEFPDATLDTKFKITLQLKNSSNYKLQCNIERKQLCKCKRIEKTIGISHRKLVYKCPHRKTIDISPKDFVVEENSILNLDFTVCYILDEKIELCFIINLSHNRQVQIFIRIRGINTLKSVTASLLNTNTIQFKDVYIGCTKFLIQLVWLYNNCPEIAKYSLYKKNVNSSNAELDCSVIQCLNPEGTINPMSNHAIKFIFAPREFRYYEFFFTIILSKSIFVDLKLIGNGIVYSPNYAPLLWSSSPRVPSITRNDEDLLKLSQEHIVIKSMHTSNTIERFLLIENISNIVLGYRWNSVKVSNIVRVVVADNKGILRPNEKHRIRIKIQAEQNACIVQNIVLSCEVFDLKQRRNYEITRVECSLHKKSLEEFVITEDNIIRPLPKGKVITCPKSKYHTISISCIILPSDDKYLDLKETVHQQLEHEPSIENYEALRMKNSINEIEIQDTLKTEDNVEKEKLVATLQLCTNILRHNISSILNCEEFKWNVLRFTRKLPPYYEELVSLPDNLEHCPTDKTVALVFRKLALQIISHQFNNMKGDIESNTKQKRGSLSIYTDNESSAHSTTNQTPVSTKNEDEISIRSNKNYRSLSQTPMYSSIFDLDYFKL